MSLLFFAIFFPNLEKNFYNKSNVSYRNIHPLKSYSTFSTFNTDGFSPLSPSDG